MQVALLEGPALGVIEDAFDNDGSALGIPVKGTLELLVGKNEGADKRFVKSDGSDEGLGEIPRLGFNDSAFVGDSDVPLSTITVGLMLVLGLVLKMTFGVLDAN